LSRLSVGCDLVVVTNPKVWKRGGRLLEKTLRSAGFSPSIFRIADTERSKSWGCVGRLLGRLAVFDRSGRRLCLVAFGGGVVGDVVGLVAALYRRGVPYVQVPTTLLAQVDSSIGGKTAVDLPQGKNLAGVFYQPRLVFIDTQWLRGLPRRQLASGLAEVIKCGIIGDPRLFRFVERRYASLLAGDVAALRWVIACAARLKAEVVSRDERETRGYRTCLNLGHTIAHALEAATRYDGRYTHGEAVAIGVSAAARLACVLGVCYPSLAHRIDALLQAVGLPIAARRLSPLAVTRALAHDKKARAGRLRWVLPTRVGHVVVTPDVTPAMVRGVLRERIRP